MRVSSLAKRMAQVAYPLLKCSGQDSFRFLRFLNFGIFAKFPTSWKIFNMNIWSVSTSQTVRDHDSLHEDSECWTFEILYYQTRQCLTCPVCICGLNSGLSRWATTPTWWRSLVCWSCPQLPSGTWRHNHIITDAHMPTLASDSKGRNYLAPI